MDRSCDARRTVSSSPAWKLSYFPKLLGRHNLLPPARNDSIDTITPDAGCGVAKKEKDPLPDTGAPLVRTTTHLGEGKIGDGLSNLTATLFVHKPTRWPGGNKRSKVDRIQYFGDRTYERQIEIMCKRSVKGRPGVRGYIILCPTDKVRTHSPRQLNSIDAPRHAPLDHHTPSTPLSDLPEVVLHQWPSAATHTCPHWREETQMSIPWLPNQVLSSG